MFKTLILCLALLPGSTLAADEDSQQSQWDYIYSDVTKDTRGELIFLTLTCENQPQIGACRDPNELFKM